MRQLAMCFPLLRTGHASTGVGKDACGQMKRVQREVTAWSAAEQLISPCLGPSPIEYWSGRSGVGLQPQWKTDLVVALPSRYLWASCPWSVRLCTATRKTAPPCGWRENGPLRNVLPVRWSMGSLWNAVTAFGYTVSVLTRSVSLLQLVSLLLATLLVSYPGMCHYFCWRRYFWLHC